MGTLPSGIMYCQVPETTLKKNKKKTFFKKGEEMTVYYPDHKQ